MATYTLCKAGYDATERHDHPWMTVEADSWSEAVAAVIGSTVSHTEPIQPRSSIHAVYRKVRGSAPAAYTKITCVEHLRTED